mgnify:CR=1 FL=1
MLCCLLNLAPNLLFLNFFHKISSSGVDNSLKFFLRFNNVLEL